eukprot:776948-Pleurochrysis_carterae.AAC.1
MTEYAKPVLRAIHAAAATAELTVDILLSSLSLLSNLSLLSSLRCTALSPGSQASTRPSPTN